MLDIDQRNQKGHKSSLAEWVTRAIGLQGMLLRTRLQGNNLHILCESSQCPDANAVVSQFVRSLKAKNGADWLTNDPDNPIYQIILYGRAKDSQRPEWVETIDLNQLNQDKLEPKTPREPDAASSTSVSQATHTGSTKSVDSDLLAQQGKPDAIARYLSKTLSPLGIRVKILIQNLADVSSSPQADLGKRRLWVVCDADYSPQESLLAEPVATQLRALKLEGFRDAVIRSSVSGEASPEWVLRIDLTPPEEMLKDWARWGDVQALARLFNQTLAGQGMEVKAVLKNLTLHLFCRFLPAVNQPADKFPPQPAVMKALAPVLEALKPQGILAASIYGVKSSDWEQGIGQQSPGWVEWLSMPASMHPTLAPTALALAQQGDPDALTFLLHRLLNPDLNQRLATGGIRLAIRRKQDLLHIMSEAPVCPPQRQVGPSVAKFLRQLGIPELAGIRVYGRRAGQSAPLWSYGIDFVSRRRHSSEATPEFTTSDISGNNIFSGAQERSTSTTEKRPPSDPLKTAVAVVKSSLQHWLCYSQLFIPSTEPTAVEHFSSNNRTGISSPTQAIKLAGICATVGLLLTLQADRLIGYVLEASTIAEESLIMSHADKALDKKPLTLDNKLPQVSGLPSTVEKPNVFNSKGFTGIESLIVGEQKTSADTEGKRRELGISVSGISLHPNISPNPAFNNRILDEKVALYQQICSTGGPPDILIVGSSRALRGVDPAVLRTNLARQGFPNLQIYNFGVNGATAQLIDLLIRRMLTPSQLPKLIIWADGARAFNSGRVDITYKAIAASLGYQQIQAGSWPSSDSRLNTSPELKTKTQPGYTPVIETLNQKLNQLLAQVSSTYPQRQRLKTLFRQQYAQGTPELEPVISNADTNPAKNLVGEEDSEANIDLDGFLPLSIRFYPSTYYQQHAKVSGDYDSDYDEFQLDGQQNTALEVLSSFLQAHQIPLVFVNLPLTKEYLDPVRKGYEAKFTNHMQELAQQKSFIFVNLGSQWPERNDYFSDPSHLNRYGAVEVSNQLAKDPTITWPKK